MASYSVAEAKDNFSRLLDEARDGENVVVTRHGKPIARVVPIEENRREARRQAFEKLIAGILPSKPGAPDSVEMLRQMYEDDDWRAHLGDD